MQATSFIKSNKLLILTIVFASSVILSYVGTMKRDDPLTVLITEPAQFKHENREARGNLATSYASSCIDLFKKIRHPNESLLFRPALSRPPANMLAEFTMNGKMPITKWWYINEVYSDAEGNKSKSSNKTEKIRYLSNGTINKYRFRIQHKMPLGYRDKILNEMMNCFGWAFFNRSMVVIGTQNPWIESIGIEIGARKVVTLDYTRANYEDQRMKWYHVNDYLDDSIEKKKIEEFDAAVSFSSIEHTGLGRYGDPLNPNGDIEAVRQIHCMLKPGGIFFLGLPTSKDGSSYIEFNAHRLYGKARLDVLFNGWKLLFQKKDSSKTHTIFVLEKNM